MTNHIVMVLAIAMAGVMATENVWAEHADAERAAIAAAQAWLKLVDETQYTNSWNEAAEYFKGAVTKEQLERSLNGVRKPLGKTTSRELKSKKYKTSLPGAPDGKYIVIQFQTSFENKKSAIETITPMLEKNGKWRVSGYYIK